MNRGRVALLLGAFVLSLVGITCYGGPVTYIFFWLVLAIPVISIVYILFVFTFIRYYQKTDGRNMTAGTPSDFYITLKNETFFAFSSLRIVFYSSFSMVNDIEPDALYELLPHSAIKKKTQLVCRYRGEYKVGIKSIAVQDFFGLFTVTRRIKEPLSVIVEPALYELDTLFGDDTREASSHENMIRRDIPAIPVREYVGGDDIRLINWKSTAAMQKLMVRERTSEEKSGITIIMDPGRYDDNIENYLPVENKSVELLLALSSYYTRNFVSHEVMLLSDDLLHIPVRDMAGFEKLHRIMVRYYFREENNIDKLLQRICDEGATAFCHMFIIILQGITAKTMELVDRINTDRAAVKILLLGDCPADIVFSDDREISIIPVGTEDDPGEVLA